VTHFIIGFFIGGAIGFMSAAMLAVGARADLLTELGDCRQRVRNLANSEMPCGDGA